MKKIGLVLALVFALFSISMVFAQDATPEAVDRTGWPETFIIGVYPGDNLEAAIASNQPLADYLTETLGVRTVIITGTSYTAVIEAMRAGRADGFEVGPFSYVLAAQEANAEALVVASSLNSPTLESVANLPRDFAPGYYSLMFTLKGSGITSIADLEGHSFAFTDPASTSGYLIPATDLMTTMGFTDPAQIETFVSPVFAGNHPAAVLAVQNGTTDAGATFDGNLITQAQAGQIQLCGYNPDTNEFPYLAAMTQEEIDAIYNDCPDGNIVVFHQSPLIPQTPFAINSALPQSFKDAVKAALLDVANHPELTVALSRYYVDPTALLGLDTLDAYYNPLRDTATLLRLDLSAR